MERNKDSFEKCFEATSTAEERSIVLDQCKSYLRGPSVVRYGQNHFYSTVADTIMVKCPVPVCKETN